MAVEAGRADKQRKYASARQGQRQRLVVAVGGRGRPLRSEASQGVSRRDRPWMHLIPTTATEMILFRISQN